MNKKIAFAVIASVITLTSSFAILDDFTYSSPNNPANLHILMIPSLSPTAVDISSQYNISIHNVSPFIVYNNTSYNNGLQNTTLHGDKTEAISNITSVWVDAAYSDDNCTMVTTSYGNTTLYSYSAGKYHNIGSPYNTEKYKQDYGKYGPITGIAGTKSYDGTGNPLIILLTEDGYIFNYYGGSWSLFENTTGATKLIPGSNWTSLTANTYASLHQIYVYNLITGTNVLISGTATYFYATNLNGTVWAWNSCTSDYGQFSSYHSPKGQGIISTAAFCDETATSDNNLYGLSYSGYIYYLTSSGWELYNTTPIPSGDVSISISGVNNPYLYVLNMHNKTSLYVSNKTITSASTSGFTETGGIVDNQETNEALTVYCGGSTSYPVFWAFQTNGTVLYDKSSSNDPTSFNWQLKSRNVLPTHIYHTFLALNDINSTIGFNTTLLYDSSQGKSNINYLSIYYNNTHLYEEFSLVNGDSDISVAINHKIPVAINLTLKPNSAYNASMNFSVVYYNNGVYISYILNINIINHFSYWNIN